MPQPRLSLCMIIRDEQEMLPEFLDSVAGLWDELIVVDTGSSDNSATLMEAAGAKLIHFDWIDDFSAARNVSLEAATGQWILFLDADERPSAELIQEIRTLMDDPMAGAATLIMRNEWPDGGRQDAPLLRIFRNYPTIRFEHRIHEDISTGVRDFLQSHRMLLRHLSGVVQHLGYVREVAGSRDKKGRDLELLNRSLQNDPNDFYCWFKILEIARFWQDHPLWENTASEVAELLNKASIQTKSDLLQRPFSGEFAALVAQGLNADDEDRLKWLDQSAKFAAPTAAWQLRRGVFLENLEKRAEATQAFQACLAPDKFSMHNIAVRAHLGLCRLAIAETEPEKAVDHIGLACTLAPRDAEALLAAVTILPLVDPTSQPGEFADEHLRKHPEAALDLGRALMGAGQVKLAGKILSPLAANQAEAALGYLVCCLVLDEDMDLQVDVQQETADQFFREWIRLLWQSRNIEAMEAFADGCGSVLGLFPWLPDFLQKETRRLK